METDHLSVSEENLRRWAGAAMTLRALEDVHARCAIPRDGSDAAHIEATYPSESYSQWALEGLRSALDHMLVWADAAVPIDERAGRPVTHQGFRWFFTLIRAALEGSAQSLWLTYVPNSGEGTARLIRSVRDDLREQRLAWIADGRDLTRIDERIAKHAAGAKDWAPYGPDIDKAPSYVDLIRKAATVSEFDPNAYEHFWRVSSAAAHGKTWAILDLQTFIGDGVEWRPGQFRTPGIVDQNRLTDAIDATVQLVTCASVQMLLRNGYDPTAEYRQSMVAVARRTPMKDGGAHVEAVARELGIK